MTRNLKILGLALAAVFAMSAVAATGASATTHDIECGVAPCWVTGTQHTTNVFETNTGKKTECNGVKFVATFSEKTNADATVTPSYSECKFAGTNATVTVNGGCTYTLTGETDANGDAEVHICPTGGNVKLKVLGGLCTLTVEKQTRRGIHYNNVKTEGKKEEVTIKQTVKGVTFSKEGVCSEVGETAEQRGEVTVHAWEDKGVNEKGEPIEGAQVDLTTTVTVP